MYKIYADNTLIYDSTIEDYKIGKGNITLEVNKSGSFVFSVYPDHFYYDKFIRLKTVITVYKSGKIIFRGRILNDVTDYWNNKVITCEGELGFLQDSIIRPFEYSGTPAQFFTWLINKHNSQVDDFKKFKIGTITVVDSNDYIARSNINYESAMSNVNNRLLELLGGYLYITHGDGTDEIPTLNYLADFTKISTQQIEFGANLKNYTKTVKAENIATVIIPLGAELEGREGQKLTIQGINSGLDYVYSESGVALYGWITKVVNWDDVTDIQNLKNKATAYLDEMIKQNITIELNAIDLHLLDRSIESFNVCDYIRVVSKPHNFDSTLLCSKQSIDLLKPENDTVVLGYTYSTFTETSSKVSTKINSVSTIQSNVKQLSVIVNNVNKELSVTTGDLEAIAEAVTQNARNIATNTTNIAKNTNDIQEVFTSVSSGKKLIASAITDKGVVTENDATFSTMAENIGRISVGGSGIDARTSKNQMRVRVKGFDDAIYCENVFNVNVTMQKYEDIGTDL